MFFDATKCMNPRLQAVNQPLEDYKGRATEQLLSHLKYVFFHLSKLLLGGLFSSKPIACM